RIIATAALGLAITIPAWAQKKSYDYGKTPVTDIQEQPGGSMGAGTSVLTFNEPIRFTFSKPVRIPGQVLPAGSYWFVVQENATAGTVSVLDANRKVVASEYG